ncbi:LysM peptidoglycan-binding domain-containing protein, partial [Clostridium perfringens]
ETVTEITYEQRDIVSGDTLWDIAAEELGDGARYPEIFEASKDIAQPGGGTITDPNWIYPGQQVNIPVATVVPVAPTDDAAGTTGSTGSIDTDEGAAGAVDVDADEGAGAAGAGGGADEGAGASG